MKNYLKLEINSDKDNAALVLAAVELFAQRLNPSKNDLEDICTCVYEAVSNCLDHAYNNNEGKILITCSVHKNNTLRVTIKDKGKGIEDVQTAMNPFYTTGNTDEHSGMGFTVMSSFADNVRVVSDLGKGTTVHIDKRIKM